MLAAFQTNDLSQLMQKTKTQEETNKELLVKLEKRYNKVLNDDNLLSVLEQLNNKQTSDCVSNRHPDEQKCLRCTSLAGLNMLLSVPIVNITVE